MDGLESFAAREPEEPLARASRAHDEETETMGYRGEDLDLRTPQSWGSLPADPAGAAQGEPLLNGMRGRQGGYGAGRSGPILVDEVVLAACNNAFEVAAANKAAEVRLEHLLNALTRIDPAVQSLEARGVRVPALRRDTAVVIAGDVPVSGLAAKAAPRRSDELEDILRAAASLGYRRNAPGSIDDLVNVLLEASADVPGLALLRQATPRAPQPPVYSEPAPAYVRSSYPAEYSDPRFARPAYQPETRPQRPELPASPTDNIQNARLETLESMVRALSNDLSSERRIFTSALQELQREVMVHRDEAGRLPSSIPEGLMTGLHERLASLESAVLTQRPGGTPDLSPLNERFATIERALNVLLSDSARVTDTLGAKAQSLEEEMKKLSSRSIDLAPLTNRLDIIEEAVLSRDGEGTRELTQRLARIEEQLKSGRERASEAEAAFSSEIATLSQAVDRQRNELAVAVLTPLAGKLDEITGAFDTRHAVQAKSLGDMMQQLVAFERSVSEYAVKSAEAGAAYAQELGEVHDALMKLNANQHTLAGSVETWRQEDVAASTALGTRVETMTASVGAMGQRVQAMSALVGTMGQRVDTMNSGVTLMGQRIEAVEREEAKTVPMLETLAGTVDRMHKVTVERYYRRNRFWYWLFGTDDWVAASWPSQAARIGDELRAVKEPGKK